MTVDLSGSEDGATFGPPLPSASDKAESLPPDVAAALDRMQSLDDAVFVATSLADLAARHGTTLRQAELAGSGTADGFTAQVGDSFSRDVDGIVSRASAQPEPRPSGSALDLLRRQAEGLRHDLTARAAVHEDALRRQQQMQSVVGALDGLHGLVAGDPASLNEATKRLDAVTGAAAPLIGADAATQLRDVEARRLTAAAVDGMIAEDPATALHVLSSGVLDHRLDDPMKAQLAARATARRDALTADAERASRQAAIAAEQDGADRSFQMVSDLNRRIVTGQATQADIADAESHGTLTADQASRLRDQLVTADQAKAADAAAAIHVARTLSDGNSLDPSSPADRAAVDAHWRTSVAPALDANPARDVTSTIGDYVSATGIAPADAVRRLTGQCFDGAPAARVAAAQALSDCLRIDPGVAGSLPIEVHDAIMRMAALADAGLPPDKAIMPVDRVGIGTNASIAPSSPPSPGDGLAAATPPTGSGAATSAATSSAAGADAIDGPPADTVVASAAAMRNAGTVTNIQPHPPATLAPDLIQQRAHPVIPIPWQDYLGGIETRGKPYGGWGTTKMASDGQEMLGRFQMGHDALKDAGMIDANDRWTGKYGVHSKSDFLNNPEAQRAALDDFALAAERELRNYGVMRYADQATTIRGVKADITVTTSGLVAAAHRIGAGTVKAYIDWVAQNGWNSHDNIDRISNSDVKKHFKWVETRLRLFQNVPYRNP